MQVNFQEALVPQGRMVPLKAVVFYGKAGESLAIQSASIHDVTLTDDGSRLKAGRPITVQAIKKLARLAADAVKSSVEILPDKVLVCNDDWIVWWRSAQVTDLSFDVSWHQEQEGHNRLQGVCLTMALPPLVFALRRGRGQSGGRGVYVFATDRNERPGPASAMYRAPLMNVNDHGDVCWGHAQAPETRTSADIGEWERLFFSSQFTHINGSSPVNSDKPYLWIADFCASGAKAFPSESLKPLRTTLQGLIKRLAGEAP